MPEDFLGTVVGLDFVHGVKVGEACGGVQQLKMDRPLRGGTLHKVLLLLISLLPHVAQQNLSSFMASSSPWRVVGICSGTGCTSLMHDAFS